MIFDAHFHLPVCLERSQPLVEDDYTALTCAHSQTEWKLQYDFVRTSDLKNRYFLSYGIHPQCAPNINAVRIRNETDFLEVLLKEKKLSAVGEAGFDYFTPEYKASAETQKIIWEIQLELAVKYNIPLVVHCRKANEKLFQYAKSLSRCPSVLFHSFMGPSREALSLLDKGINGFFSFGKQMMNNNKKVIDCVKTLPSTVLLLETDAPFQTLKGESNTLPKDILTVYHEAARLRGEPVDEFTARIWETAGNFFHRTCP